MFASINPAPYLHPLLAFLSWLEHSTPGTLSSSWGPGKSSLVDALDELCCHSQQWDLSVLFWCCKPASLVNPPAFLLLPTCHFSCATETQLDLNLSHEGCVFTNSIHQESIIWLELEPDTFLIISFNPHRNSPSLEMKRLIRRLSCLPRFIQLVSQRSVIWTGFCVQAHTPLVLFLWQPRGQCRAAVQQAALIYTRQLHLRNVALTRLLKASHSSVHR